jgi:CRISPR-associated protein Cas1
VLSEFGLFLGRKRNRYVVRNGDAKNEILSTDVEQLHILNPGVSLSISALRLALSNQTLVVLGSRNGWPHGFVIPAKISGTIKAKREQFLAYHDFRGAVLAKKFASGKSFNQRNLLKLLWKNRVKTEPALAEKMYKASEEVERLAREIDAIEGSSVDKIRTDVMNREARASKEYWDAVSNLFPEELKFPGRKTRGATDPVNAMLNFGYKAILFVECWKAVYYSGLDPYAGYLHADRPGKPSLALDLMEEFRQHVVDRVLFSIFSKKMLKVDEIMVFDEAKQQQRLNKQTIQVLIGEITGQLESEVAYGRNSGERCYMKNVIQNQSRAVVSYLMNPSKEYDPFELAW